MLEEIKLIDKIGLRKVKVCLKRANRKPQLGNFE